ncbi:MAG: GNAT family N-acetyltransferase [Spirochaetota bacterium]
MQIQHLGIALRQDILQIIQRFRKETNQLTLDGVYRINKRYPVKLLDIYFKLQGTGKVLCIGAFSEASELVAVLLARVEEKPFLHEEKVIYIDLAVTKKGKEGKGFMTGLLDFAENWAQQKQIRSLELRAIAENQPAVEFWKKRGYGEFYVGFRKTV